MTGMDEVRRVRTGAKAPQDHKTKTPAKKKTPTRPRPTTNGPRAEVERASITVDFEGQPYTITHLQVDNLELYELIEDNKAITATREFLGREQWERLKSQLKGDGNVVSTGRFNEFLNALMEEIGGN